MSEINFLSETDNQKNNKEKAGKPEPAPEIVYSKPAAEGPAVRANFSKVPARSDALRNETGKNNNLRQKRKAVLTSIKKEKQNTGQILSAKTGFISGLKDKFGAILKRERPEEKKEKEILAESKEIFDKEKSVRKNNQAPEKNIAEGNLKKDGPEHKNKWKAVKVLKTNLIQDEVTVFVDWSSHLKGLFGYLSIVFLLVVAAYGGLIFWEMQTAQERQAKSIEIEELKQKIVAENKEVEEIQIFQKNLALANLLLSKHIYWTNFFDFLEKNTLRNVYYSGGFSGNTDGEYSFPAVAEDFESISDQLTALKGSKYVISARVDSGDLSVSKGAEEKPAKNIVNFTINLKLDPKLFTSQ